MSGMTGIDINTISVQIKSLMIYEFLNEYTRLEKMIHDVLAQNVSSLPAKILHQLYFYYGGRVGTRLDYENEAVELRVIKYKDNEQFKDLTINQIVKILQKNPCFAAFNFEIQSINRATTTFSFYDCVIRLIGMRNKLAHEMVNLNFKDQHLIELLSPEQLEAQKFQILQSFDIHKMDNMTQYIASNLVYMYKIIAKLDSIKEDYFFRPPIHVCPEIIIFPIFPLT